MRVESSIQNLKTKISRQRCCQVAGWPVHCLLPLRVARRGERGLRRSRGGGTRRMKCLLPGLNSLLQTQQTKGSNRARQTSQVKQGRQQQTPESPTVIISRHASKYKVHKLRHRYILRKDARRWPLYPPRQAHSAIQVCKRKMEPIFVTHVASVMGY